MQRLQHNWTALVASTLQRSIPTAYIDVDHDVESDCATDKELEVDDEVSTNFIDIDSKRTLRLS